jgi:predicted glycoside hydrolase/deacetylase ChbG (UPF0249 family)
MKKGRGKKVTKRLIVNADDFGLTEGINRGILEGFREGIITSTSLLATAPAFDHAVQLALENDLDMGVHVSLTEGKPCSRNDGLHPILQNGAFAGLRRLASLLYTGGIQLADIKRELDSQIARVYENGLRINHINGHQHILMFPCLFKLTVELMKEYSIGFVRIPAERVLPAWFTSVKGWGFLGLALLAAYHKRKAGRLEADVGTTDHFVGLHFSERMNSRALMGVLSSLKPGITELMCHPGYEDRAVPGISENSRSKERELCALKCSQVIRFVEANRIELTGYGAILK